MTYLLLGAGMGVGGGLIPSPLHLIALAQVALGHWRRAIFVMFVPPLIIDGALLVLTALFYQFIPLSIARYMGYLGGGVLILFALFSLFERRGKTPQDTQSKKLQVATVSVAALMELAAPGTWIYWLTIAGPIIAEGRVNGYWTIAPFFIGGLVGYYGASVLSVWLINWGTKLHSAVEKRLFLIANLLLLILGASYILRAAFEH
jgi:threonine/homoserine/homoserine lactone efflux protein